MSRYDGLIIPRSYSEYINKTDAATLSQALQLNNVMDDTPTEDSVKPIKSGGVYDAIAGLENEINGKQDALTFDDVPTDGSTNPVTSDGIYDALGTKQDTLTFDDTPTAGSNNPVKSGGIKNAITKFLKGDVVGHLNNYYAKITVTIDANNTYTSTLIALQARGGATCLVSVGGSDSGNASVILLQKISGSWTPSFYYKIIDRVTVEFYWTINAYTTVSNYQILSNALCTTVTTGNVQTLPSGTTQL